MTALLVDQLPVIASAPNAVNKLRELILQLAVMGKLVKQDPNDEPASELLRKMQKEISILVKEKKLRKDKSLPEIRVEDHPFNIPASWAWIRLGQIGDWGAGATPLRSNLSYYGGSIPWFKSGELTEGVIFESEETVTELALNQCSLRQNKAGDVLIAMYGATIGKTAILGIAGTTNQAVCACTPFSGVTNKFLLLLLKGLKSALVKQGAGAAQPNISREKIVATVAGLPPLAEQQRIVAKVEELMALCDKFKVGIRQARQLQEQLGTVIIAKAVKADSTEESSAVKQATMAAS